MTRNARSYKTVGLDVSTVKKNTRSQTTCCTNSLRVELAKLTFKIGQSTVRMQLSLTQHFFYEKG